MSTKISIFYAQTESFLIHGYSDFSGLDGVQIHLGDSSTFYPFSKEELIEISKQLEENAVENFKRLLSKYNGNGLSNSLYKEMMLEIDK